MEEKGNSWLPPLEFYFSVEFQWGSRHVKASFMEVSGLNVTLESDPVPQQGNDATWIHLPRQIKPDKVVLKRALEPLSEEISAWTKKCLSYSVSGWINPCLLKIQLLNMQHEIAAAWTCAMAYPVKCDISPFNSGESKLVIETLTMTCSRLERVQ